MKHKNKGFKENPLILKEMKIYVYQNTKKIKKIGLNAWLFREHPFALHPARCGQGYMRRWTVNTSSKHVAFSRDPNPIKSKIKEIVFSERKLRFEHVPVKLNGVPLIMRGKVKVPREYKWLFI
jgi:hypothetical protein